MRCHIRNIFDKMITKFITSCTYINHNVKKSTISVLYVKKLIVKMSGDKLNVHEIRKYRSCFNKKIIITVSAY